MCASVRSGGDDGYGTSLLTPRTFAGKDATSRLGQRTKNGRAVLCPTPVFNPRVTNAFRVNVTANLRGSPDEKTLGALENTLAAAVQASTHPNQAIGAFLVALCHHLGWVAGIFYVVDPASPRMLTATHEVHLRAETRLRALQLIAARPPGEDMQGLGGLVLDGGDIVVFPDISREKNFRAREYAELLNLSGALAVPIYVGDRLGAVAEFFAAERLDIDDNTRNALSRVASTLGMRLAAIPELTDADPGL